MKTSLTPEEKEQAIAEFRQQFEQQVEDAIKPCQQFLPIGIAIILLGLLMTIIGFLSWLPTLPSQEIKIAGSKVLQIFAIQAKLLLGFSEQR